MISTQPAGNKCALIGRLNSYHTIWMTDKMKNRYVQASILKYVTADDRCRVHRKSY